MGNFIKLNREILDHWVFADEKTFKIWVWLLARAKYEDGSISLQIGKGNSVVKLKRGQLIFGRFKAEESLNMDGSLIYRRLQKFEQDDMIKVESNNHYTIITICNYDTWQSENIQIEQPLNNQRTTDEQPSNTYKKDKKEKEIILWRKDFEFYRKDCKEAFANFYNSEQCNEVTKTYPDLDIVKTINKMYLYWYSEDGWKQKKKSKVKTIDWNSTIRKGFSFEFNQVLK